MRWLTIWIVVTASAQLVAVENPPRDFSKPQTYLKLADYFADEGDYYRAITEYKKVIYFFPNYEKLPWVHFQIGRMYYEGGRYSQAKYELLPLTDGSAATTDGSAQTSDAQRLKFLAHNYIAMSYYENSEFANSERLFSELKTEPLGLKFRLDYSLYIAMSQAGKKQFADAHKSMGEAKNLWQSLEQNSAIQYEPFFNRSISILSSAAELSQKSVFWSVFFAILFPGGGHFYLREWDTGVVSFSLVGGAAFLAYDGFMRQSAVQSILFTTFASGIYIGSIYSAYRTAVKFNLEVGDKETRELQREFKRLNIRIQHAIEF